jgi:hypothetical protein
VAAKRTAGSSAKAKAKPAPAKKPGAKPKPAPAKAATGDTVYTLKIVLKWLKPDIWRRVEVPDCTLEDLHWVIQLCMPWDNSHMWEFRVGRERYGMDMDDAPFAMDDDDGEPAHTVTLSKLVADGVKKFEYTYDFGDSWDHVITFEKPAARDPKATYPRCVAGQYACPPDDCGGAPGYGQLLEVLADKKHPDHEHMMEWAGGPIDPEAFDLDAINKNLRQLKLK